MKDLINKVFEEKMQDGTIEKIIADKINEMVIRVCESQMGYNGDAKKAMEARIAPLFIQAVETCDLGKMVEKITAILNASLRDSDLDEYSRVCDGAKELFNGSTALNTIRQKRVMKLSEIFEEYKKHLEYVFDKDDFDEDEIEYGDERQAVINCTMSVELDESELYRKRGYVVTLSTDKSSDEKTGDVRFRLRWDYCGTELYLKADLRDLSLSELRHCPPFILYLSCIEREWIRVEIDKEYDEDAVYIDCEKSY